eukprot:SAG31_NODE_65_length_28565_cov_8.402914_29_plen_1206_part_00
MPPPPARLLLLLQLLLLLDLRAVRRAVLGMRKVAAAAASCLYNLTQPAYHLLKADAHGHYKWGGSSQYLSGQGQGWLEGDFDSTAFVNVPGATLSLRLNGSAGLPALGVDITWRGQAAPPGAQAAHVAAESLSGGGAVATVDINITGWPDGEFAALIAPDAASVGRGWCGGLVRFLRKGTEPVAPGLQCRGDAACPPLRLPPGQPMLLMDDLWVWSRVGAARRLVPAEQMRVSNDSFATRSPVTGKAFPWMDDDQTNALRVGIGGKSLDMGIKINWSAKGDPHHDPNASVYGCTGELDWNASSRTGSERVTWSCRERSSAPSELYTCEINPGSGLKSCVETVSGTMTKASCLRTCHVGDVEAEPPTAWPPPYMSDWAIQDATVRWYDPAADGPVDINALSVYYTYGVHYKFPEVIGNVTFPALSGTPVWRLIVNGSKLALALPVEGKRQPLIYAESNPDQVNGSRDHCNSFLMGRPNGPNTSDFRCVNDNFGGAWSSPPQTIAGVNIPASYTYVQARRVPAFAPKVAPYDNLNTVRRILVRWVTTDGLHWEQRWWGEQPSDEIGDELVPQHYGADNFCPTDGTATSHKRSPSFSCLASNLDDPGATVLSTVFPYDSGLQTFGLDLMWSRHGGPFKAVESEVLGPDGMRAVPVLPKDRPQFAPTGSIGQHWNSGFICGIRGPVPLGRFSYAVMPMVDNSAHFMGGWAHAAPNGTPAAPAVFEAWGRDQFWGPTVHSWPYFDPLGGWAGLAALANRYRVEVGVLRWRQEGWVALEAGKHGATVMTRPILAPPKSFVTINLNTTTAAAAAAATSSQSGTACALVHLELLNLTGDGVANLTTPIPGFSGKDAAKVCVDDIASKLVWGDSASLPPSATTRKGVVFRIDLIHGMQLFGLKLHDNATVPLPLPPPPPAPPQRIPIPDLGTCAGCDCADPCMGFPGPDAHPIEQYPKNCSIPQVLLIGDSIAGPPLGYSADVQRILGTPTPATVENGSANPDGIAHVQFVAGFPSQLATKCMSNWTKYVEWSSGGFDVIHFNSGLHDIDLTEFVPIEQYVKNLDAAFVLASKALKPGGKFIWASTTPVPYPTAYPLRNNSAVLQYNHAARQLFESKGVGVVGINDLYLDVMARCGEPGNKLGSYKSCELHVDSCGWDPCCGESCKNGSMPGCPPGSCVSSIWGNVHFTAKGRRFLAEGVARSISLHLHTNHTG